MSDAKPVVLNASVYWCENNKLNEMSGKYQIVLGNLSDKAVEAIEEAGVTVRNKGNDQGNYITCKSKNPIRVYDSEGDEIPPQVNIGNGSEAVAQVGFYNWTFGKNTGTNPTIMRLNIKELVEYMPDSIDADAEVL